MTIRRVEWIIALVGFLLIPTIFGLVIYFVSGETLCPIDLSNFFTCIIGAHLLLSFATGGLVWAVAIIGYLLHKIKAAK